MSDIELFSTWLPVDVIKGDNENEPAKTKIGGIISTDTVDQQGDMLLQEGMDFSYFIDKGWFNYEHKQGTEYILGAPTKVEPIMIDGKQATRVEGYLLNDRPRAREIIDTAKAIKRANLPRTIGFSVEGQVLARDKKNPKLITRSRILNVAITSAPVNPDAKLEVLARALINLKGLSPSEIASKLLDKHPEIARPEVMEALHELMNKGGEVGYASPAQPDANAELSPLVTSDINDELSIEDDMMNKMRIEMSDMIDERIQEIKESMYDYTKAMPVVSASKVTEMLLRVFPHLSQGQARQLAVNLVSSAKTKYNT